MNLLLILLQDGAEGAGGIDPAMGQMLLFGGVILIFWFFIIRPQSKRQKDERKFREALQKGDRVKTVGGIYGNVEQIDEDSVLIRVDNNTKLRVDKVAIRPQVEEKAKK
ncbi:MAG: preprotein translocase subunit YajC [Bacteroidota bacterium]